MQELQYLIPPQQESWRLITLIEKSVEKYSLEGVTLLGGEPFLQAEGCAEIAEWCKKNSLSVIAFTGFLFKDLLAMNDPNVNRVLQLNRKRTNGKLRYSGKMQTKH